VTVAEKFEATVHLGSRNSRMKDFHDIWALSEIFPFEGVQLRAAVAACFERRGTILTVDAPEVLAAAFYSQEKLQGLWHAYRRSGGFGTLPPESFEEIGVRVRDFLGPVRESIVAGTLFEMLWPLGGSWQPVGCLGEEDERDV